MIQPDQAVDGSDEPVIAAEPTIEDRFTALSGDEQAEEPAERPPAAPDDPIDDPTNSEEAEAAGEAEGPPIEPPPSWSAEEREAFDQLPRSIQQTLIRREAERERTVQDRTREASLTRSRVEGEAR